MLNNVILCLIRATIPGVITLFSALSWTRSKMSVISHGALIVILPVGEKCRHHDSSCILPTQQRPNLVLINESSKLIIIMELTVPFLSTISTKIMFVNLKDMRASPVICKNRVMTPSSCVLRLVAKGSLLILIRVHFNLFYLGFLTTKNFWSRSQKISEISQSTCNSLLLCYILFKIWPRLVNLGLSYFIPNWCSQFF